MPIILSSLAILISVASFLQSRITRKPFISLEYDEIYDPNEDPNQYRKPTQFNLNFLLLHNDAVSIERLYYTNSGLIKRIPKYTNNLSVKKIGLPVLTEVTYTHDSRAYEYCFKVKSRVSKEYILYRVCINQYGSIRYQLYRSRCFNLCRLKKALKPINPY